MRRLPRPLRHCALPGCSQPWASSFSWSSPRPRRRGRTRALPDDCPAHSRDRVAVAYGPSSDPSYETVVAAPFAMVRLVLLRTLSVLVTSVPLVVVTGLVLPTSPIVAVAWLLPAAGFIAVVLTASNWVDPTNQPPPLASPGSRSCPGRFASTTRWQSSRPWHGRLCRSPRGCDPRAAYRLFGSTPSWRLH